MRGRLTGGRLAVVGMLASAGALALLLAVAAPRSRAVYYPPQCGGDHILEPRHHPPGQRPPLAIGDSTMLLAADDLAAAGFEVDAQGCRQYDEALQILARRRADGTLPHMVVIALGADGSVTHEDIGRALGLLCCTHLLVLVTPRELGGGSGSDADATREEVARHPSRARLLDWVAYSAGHGDWFQPDGLHLTDVGALAFTRLLARALPWAYPPVAPAWTRWWQGRCRQGTAPPAPSGNALAAATRWLVPRGFVGIRLCRYAARLAGAVVLGPRTAGALADDLNALRGHANPACPQPPRPVIARVVYPHRRVLAVWVRTAGCPTVTNGVISHPASRALVRELERLTRP